MIDSLPSIENIRDKGQRLTIEAAQKLHGKNIICFSEDEPGTRKLFTVGDVVNAYEYAATQFCSDLRYTSMQKYFDAACAPDALDQVKNKYLVFSSAGEAVYSAFTGQWNKYDTPRFVSKSIDVEVLYIELS